MAYSLSDCKFVARYVVGNANAEKLPDEELILKQTDELNAALASGGRLVGQEKTFFIRNIGAHQVISRDIFYRVGFERKPYWFKA